MLDELGTRIGSKAIRSSGLDYTVVRAAFLLNWASPRHAIHVSQDEAKFKLPDCIARADAAEVLVEALFHPKAARTTFEIKWGKGPPQSNWSVLLNGLEPDA